MSYKPKVLIILSIYFYSGLFYNKDKSAEIYTAMRMAKMEVIMKVSKKFIALIISIIFTLSLFGAFQCLGAAETITAGTPVFSKVDGGVETVVSAPENGMINTSINVTYNAVLTNSTTATLVVTLLDKATGRLMAADFDTETIAGGSTVTLKKGLQVTDIASSTYRYFLWDSLTGRVPLENSPPSMPSNLSILNVTTGSTALSWNSSLDDNNSIKGYNIYRDGENAGFATANEFTEKYLEQGHSYYYEVEAVDSEGLVSARAGISANTKAMETCTLTDPIIQNQVTFTLNTDNTQADSYTELTEKSGRQCRTATTKPRTDGTGSRIGMFYFKVDPSYINSTVSNVAIEITYFDSGTGNITMQYNAADDSVAKSVTIAQRTDTNNWKTAGIVLTDAKFTNPSALTYSSFRISGGDGFCIYKLGVCKAEDYTAPGASASLGAVTDLNKLSYWWENAGGDANTTAPSIYEGKDCGVAITGKYFEFNTDDFYISKTDNMVYIKVTYFDSGTDPLLLEYNSTTNDCAAKEIPMTGTNTWKTQTVALTNAAFQGKLTGGDARAIDFRLSLKSAFSPLYIKNVYVTKEIIDYTSIKSVYSIMGENGVDFGISVYVPSTSSPDSYTANAVKADKNCRLAGSGKNFYFLVNNDFMNGSRDNQATITITYFDEGTNVLNIQYNSSDTSLAGADSVPKGNTRYYKTAYVTTRANTLTWKTASVTISDAAFANKQDAPSYADFRIPANSTSGLYISKIQIDKP